MVVARLADAARRRAAVRPPQVELYAEFEPARLLHFLMVSPSYPLERAYQVRGMRSRCAVLLCVCW